MPKPVYINDLASFLPNDPVSNNEIEHVLGMVNGHKSRSCKIVLKNNGIKERYYAIDPETGKFTHNNAQLTSQAIQNLAKKSGISINDIDCLTCGTSSPDQIQPAHGHMVQGELKMPPCEVLTTAGVCLSGISAMKYAYLNILSGQSKQAISTGSEFVSSCMRASNFETEDPKKVEDLKKKPGLAFEKDFLRWMLSDGAGAALLGDKPNEGRLSLRIDWIDIFSYSGELPVCMYAGADKRENGTIEGWREVDNPYELINKHYFALKQDARILEEHIVSKSVETLKRISKKRSINFDDINWFLPHYSSDFFRPKFYDNLIREGININSDKWFTNLQRIGNIGSASIYLIMEELFYSDNIRKGDNILCFIPESARFSIGYMHLTAV